MSTEVEVAEIPDCDICKGNGVKTPAEFDGATAMGPWAYMCLIHFMAFGRGLGTGRGQKLILRQNPKG
jgi:hypothetical protein